MPETQAVAGMRISNRSADRLRYFGRGFFAAAVDMRLAPVPQFPLQFLPEGTERFDYSVAAQQPAAVKSKSTSCTLNRAESLDAQSPRSRRHHRRRRSDRLFAPLPHRERRDARQRSAGDPANAGDPRREGAKSAEGRDDGA